MTLLFKQALFHSIFFFQKWKIFHTLIVFAYFRKSSRTLITFSTCLERTRLNFLAKSPFLSMKSGVLVTFQTAFLQFFIKLYRETWILRSKMKVVLMYFSEFFWAKMKSLCIMQNRMHECWFVICERPNEILQKSNKTILNFTNSSKIGFILLRLVKWQQNNKIIL